MRSSLFRLAAAAMLSTVSPAVFAQTNVVNPTTVMINGIATPVQNGPLGTFVGNVGANTGTSPVRPDGTQGQLPASEFAKTPLITPDLAAAAIGELRVPDEFEGKVFATPPIVNYPTTVAASYDGMVFVGVDGNGAQSAWDHLGRVIRLRDTNGDGVADEAKAFVPDIDSVRGLVWNHDHLIVMAAPNITVYWDRDGDGVAEESKVIIKNIGRTLADARVDHGQNSLEAGMDGWIYLAEGDQGFRDATGTDGRKITLRGGGVIRFREDGSGLEVWAQGTRNIYGVAVGPLLDAFARDNTNDGGGWNVRMHYFSGMTDHGYPSLFTNFTKEAIEPLADYGGGSGTGAVWIDEPGIPAHWNNAPFTADYGQRALFMHRPTPNGATFTITNEPFIQFGNPMDADIDANSNIYLAKWAGGFSWAGRNNGIVYRVSPKGYTPPPLPNFDTLTAPQLVAQLQSASYRLRLEAQRAILRRKAQVGAAAAPLLEALASDRTKPLAHRTAALFTDKQLRGAATTQYIARLVADPTIAALALRALGDDLAQAKSIPIETVTGALRSSDPRTRKEAMITLARANAVTAAPQIANLMGDADPVIALTAVQVLRSLRAVPAALQMVDSTTATPAVRTGALQVLQTIHEQNVTDALEQRLARETNPARRGDLVAALARLANTETAWNGTWWATRPQNVGPYFAAAPWGETSKIMATLNSVLDKAGPEEVLAMGRQYVKQGVSAGAAVNKFLAFADSEPALVPQITSYFATSADDIPANAIPVLSKVATTPAGPNAPAAITPAVRAEAVVALARTSDRAVWANGVLPAMPLLSAGGGAAAGGRGGGGGRGGAAAAPAATPIPGANQTQTLLITSMDTANNALLQKLTDARTALTTASWSTDRAAIPARVTDVAAAELALATARADGFGKIQASAGKLNRAQAQALAANAPNATPAAPAAAAGGRAGGGGGGRGGAGGGAAALTPADQARAAIFTSSKLDDVYPVLITEAAKLNGEASQTADAALLTLASRKFGAGAASQAASAALDAGWTNPSRKVQIMLAAVSARDTSRATQIIAAQNDPDIAVSRTAQYALQQLSIDPAALAAAAAAPKVSSMQPNAVLDAVLNTKGTLARGQQLTRELGCYACHTFSSSEPPKGPFLGAIAAILQRRDLAEAIMNPGKSIAQGFPMTIIRLKDGTNLSGFVIRESGDSLLLGDASAKQTRVSLADIGTRRTVETSVMPPGLVSDLTISEFASLVDYIESLSPRATN